MKAFVCVSMANVLVLLIVLRAPVSLGGRILVYPFGHCLNSHLVNAEVLSDLLVNDGHQVSMLISTAYERYNAAVRSSSSSSSSSSSIETSASHLGLLQFKAPLNYTPICEYDTMDFMLYAPLNTRFRSMIETMVRYCNALLSDKALMFNLKAKNFDLFILEAVDPCSRILADYLDIPFIPLMTTGLGHFDGNPRPPSYLPAAIAPFTTNMNFGQRVGNFVMKMMYDFIPVLMGFEQPFEELKRIHGFNTSLSIAQTFNRASIKLVNSNFAIEYPSPVEPDTVLVGGFAIRQARALSSELEAIMQSAGESGVIVVCFGTLTKRFGHRWTRLFVDAFSRLPQKVIWRYVDEIDGSGGNVTISDNIHRMKWLPQTDLLAHQQTKLLISHCGLNSMFETIYYGVPVVAMPLSGDQLNHASKMTEHLGMAVRLDPFTVTSNQLLAAVEQVLHNPTFAANAKIVSRRLHDQPMSAADKVRYWVDYVIRNKGAPHLKSKAHQLTWYQYFSLDVIAFLFCVAFTVLSGVTFLLCKLSKRLFRFVKTLPGNTKIKMQ